MELGQNSTINNRSVSYRIITLVDILLIYHQNITPWHVWNLIGLNGDEPRFWITESSYSIDELLKMLPTQQFRRNWQTLPQEERQQLLLWRDNMLNLLLPVNPRQLAPLTPDNTYRLLLILSNFIQVISREKRKNYLDIELLTDEIKANIHLGRAGIALINAEQQRERGIPSSLLALFRKLEGLYSLYPAVSSSSPITYEILELHNTLSRACSKHLKGIDIAMSEEHNGSYYWSYRCPEDPCEYSGSDSSQWATQWV